ncbi:unnamed protein product [Hydatigera taeniaeformis]|uniref:Transmembrane protein n=1 Tax=Hydatigena taeniaeformis TaxID=6205 RepID=A0A0R3WLC2_HYDTA|nr:unnamed protein product [Hydatigera taeniaeformis]
MLVKEQYDILGNLITTTTTTTPGLPTTASLTLPPTPVATTETTTTSLPTVFPADNAAPLNVFERYTHLEAFLSRFTPIGLEVDRSTTAIYLPLSVLGLTLTAAVLFTWHARQDTSKTYAVDSTAPPLLPPPLWRRWRDRQRGDTLLYLLGFLSCPLLLIHCSFCLLLDLDGVWRLRLLSSIIGIRAFCPLVHSLAITTRVTIALLVLLIAWRAHVISRPPRLRTISCHCRSPYLRFWWCKIPCGLFAKATAIILVSFVAGLMGINFWHVTDITLPGTSDNVDLICSPIGGYQSGFQFLSPDGTLLLYDWVLNAVIFAPSTLGTIAFAFLLSRRLLSIQSQALLQSDVEVGGRMAFVYTRHVIHRLQLVNGLCLLFGLANLPLVATRLLSVMTTPGVAELPDREILDDPTWQRMLHHATAIIICREFADMATTGLLFPTFMVISSTFRHRFLRLLRLKGPHSLCGMDTHDFSRRFWGMAGRPQGQPPQPSFSPAKADSPPVRWSWGKGWRQSYSLPLSPPVVESTMAFGEQRLAEGADPDHLDAIVEQHNNAYAFTGTSRGGFPHHYAKHRASFAPLTTSKRLPVDSRRTCYL